MCKNIIVIIYTLLAVVLGALCDVTKNLNRDRDRDQGWDQKYDGTGIGTKDRN